MLAAQPGAGGSGPSAASGGSPAGTGGVGASGAVQGSGEAGSGGALSLVGSGGQAGSSGEGSAGASTAVLDPPAAALSVTPDTGIWSSVRGQQNPPVLTFQINNAGATALRVDAVDVVDSDLFAITNAPPLPVTIAAGASVPVSVQLITALNALPAPPPQDSGSTVAAGALSITAGAVSARARLHGIILTQAIWEPTFGQVLDALGHDVNIGNTLRTNANPDTMPGVEAGTDEIDAPLFVRAGPGDVSLKPVARFSPVGVMPFGFYTPGDANARTEVGAMDEQDDPHTSNKARLLLPPVTGSTSFDPGPGPFGVWAFTNQLAEGNPQNGNHLFTEDALNATGGPHRIKVYPLADAAGTAIASSYLLACEEAANGDYQDYVFILSNVTVAP